MIKRGKIYFAPIAVLVGLLFAGPLGPGAALGEAPKDKIRIGYSISLSGPYAPAAAAGHRAYQLWAEQVNKKGGIMVREYGKRLPVELVFYDDRFSGDVAVRIYEKLITSDKVDLLLTPFATDMNFAVIPTAERYKVPMIGATASSIKIREMKTKYFWFITPLQADKVMRSLTDFLKSRQDQIKTVAVIYTQALYARENLEFLLPYLKDAGFTVVERADYPFAPKDLTPLLSKIKAKNPDAVIALNYYPESVLLVNQSREVGLSPKLFFQLLGPAADFYLKALGPSTEGITTMGQWSPKINWPGSRQFYEDYVARWKEEPNYLDSILSFIEAQVLEQAVEKAGTLNWEKIREVIATEEFITAGGPVKFTGPENFRTPAMIDQIQQGAHEIIWPQEFATSKPVFPKPAWK